MFVVAHGRTQHPHVIFYVHKICCLRHIDPVLVGRQHVWHNDFASRTKSGNGYDFKQGGIDYLVKDLQCVGGPIP